MDPLDVSPPPQLILQLTRLVLFPSLVYFVHCETSSDPQGSNSKVTCVSAAYIQTTRALMITGSILGFLAVVMLLMSMPCISLGNEAQSSKNRRAVLGGVLVLIVGKN